MILCLSSSPIQRPVRTLVRRLLLLLPAEEVRVVKIKSVLNRVGIWIDDVSTVVVTREHSMYSIISQHLSQYYLPYSLILSVVCVNSQDPHFINV